MLIMHSGSRGCIATRMKAAIIANRVFRISPPDSLQPSGSCGDRRPERVPPNA